MGIVEKCKIFVSIVPGYTTQFKRSMPPSAGLILVLNATAPLILFSSLILRQLFLIAVIFSDAEPFIVHKSIYQAEDHIVDWSRRRIHRRNYINQKSDQGNDLYILIHLISLLF